MAAAICSSTAVHVDARATSADSLRGASFGVCLLTEPVAACICGSGALRGENHPNRKLRY